MGNLNKKNIINQAEKILEKCEEKYKEEGNKKRVRDLERECKKLKRHNLVWKILLSLSLISLLIIVI